MTSMGTGIEAALMAGLPPAATGGSAGLGATTHAGSMLRAARTATDGPASFRAALRAAAKTDESDPAAGRPFSAELASAPARDGDTAQETDSLESDDPVTKTKTTEAPAETQATEGPSSIGTQWIGSAPAAVSSKISPAGTFEAVDTLAENLTGDETAKEAVPQEWTELLDLLSRLQQALTNDPASAPALIPEVSESIEKCLVSTDTPPGAGPQVRQVLTDLSNELRDALPEAVSELVSISGETQTADPAREGVFGGDGRELPEPADAPAVRQTVAVAEILPAVRRAVAQLRDADTAVQLDETASTFRGDSSGVKAGAAAGHSSMFRAEDVTAANAPVLPATPQHEAMRSSAPSEPSRFVDTGPDSSGSVAETRQEGSPESGDFRQAADHASFSKVTATVTPATGDADVLPEGFSMLTREAHLSPGADGGLDRTAEVPAAVRDKETTTGTGRAAVFDQIVQRAAVQLKNDQGEINIDLKPDFLGRVRMQILTENQQVSVRIVTELSAVRDMIETGLNQLKSELQSQGIQVERLEVSVADDHRQRGWQRANTASAWKTTAANDVSAIERSDMEERSASPYYRSRSGGTAGIDMFV